MSIDDGLRSCLKTEADARVGCRAVARTWLRIRVDVLGGRGIELDPAPGRVMIVGPAHTFEQLAQAIDAAFARWDLSHLHEFELADGRRIGFPDDESGPEREWLDHAKLKVAREVGPGDEFTYTFDLGDDRRHRCVVEKEKADPRRSTGRCRRDQSRSGAGARSRTSTAGAASTGGIKTKRTPERDPRSHASMRCQITAQPTCGKAPCSSGRRS